MRKLKHKLCQWYNENKRELPWRATTDAYHIWVSEIILQQTQVKQGLPYYERFVLAHPDVQSLALAPEDDVLKLWQGLGYYSRARNMQNAARQVISDFEGVFPTTYDELLTLKGVGDYTASAVSSFSSGEVRACVDGNVIRVLARLFGVEEPYDKSIGKKQIKALADEFLDVNDSAAHNQAIMEFGAMQCTPKSPQCESCIFRSQCYAFGKNMVNVLPVKSLKVKVKTIFMYYFVMKHNGYVTMQQRGEDSIWKRLYEFPLLESGVAIESDAVISYAQQTFDLDENSVFQFSSVYTHILSHRKIQAVFVTVSSENLSLSDEKVLMVQEGAFSQYPVSRLVERFWEDYTKE